MCFMLWSEVAAKIGGGEYLDHGRRHFSFLCFWQYLHSDKMTYLEKTRRNYNRHGK